MTTSRVVLEPAFVLHSRAYRDSSLLVELLTMRFGRLTVIARGVRNRKSRIIGSLALFSPLLVSFSGKTDLQTLQQVEANGLGYNLNGNVLFSGFYLNELLMRLLQRHDPHPNIYKIYQQTLDLLSRLEKPEFALRLFEKYLLDDIGFGLQLNREINNEPVLENEKYVFEFGVGLKKSKFESLDNFSGKSLLALQLGELKTTEELRDAKRLLRSVFAILLGNKPLKSRELFLSNYLL